MTVSLVSYFPNSPFKESGERMRANCLCIAAAAGEPGASNQQGSSESKHEKDRSHSGGTMAHIKEKVERVIHPHKS